MASLAKPGDLAKVEALVWMRVKEREDSAASFAKESGRKRVAGRLLRARHCTHFRSDRT